MFARHLSSIREAIKDDEQKQLFDLEVGTLSRMATLTQKSVPAVVRMEHKLMRYDGLKVES